MGEWGPEGYEFPTRDPCNRSSKDAEHKFALLVRIKAKREDDPVRRLEFRKYVSAMRNNLPDLPKPLTANEKRRFLKSEGLTRGRGFALADVHAVGFKGDETELLSPR